MFPMPLLLAGDAYEKAEAWMIETHGVALKSNAHRSG